MPASGGGGSDSIRVLDAAGQVRELPVVGAGDSERHGPTLSLRWALAGVLVFRVLDGTSIPRSPRDRARCTIVPEDLERARDVARRLLAATREVVR